jgi:hypothetical protein
MIFLFQDTKKTLSASRSLSLLLYDKEIEVENVRWKGESNFINRYMAPHNAKIQPWPTQIGSRATFFEKSPLCGPKFGLFLKINRFCFKIAFFKVCRRATFRAMAAKIQFDYVEK